MDGCQPSAGTRCAAEQDAWSRDVYAALDLGTNNCRLLVARPSPDGFTVLDAYSRIVRLGENLAATGCLTNAAMQRTLAALRTCAEKMRRNGVTRARAVATEACRRAANCDAFVDLVRRETGIELEVIDQSEEARLALYGCAPLLRPDVPNALVFDIGGGSTELSWLTLPPGAGPELRLLPNVAAYHSMPVGVVGLAECYGADSVSRKVYESMVAEAAAALQPFARRHLEPGGFPEGRVQMLGTSGTATTLAGVYQNLPRYDRRQVDGCYMGFDTVQSISRRITAMSYAERVNHPCIGGQRADLVIAGCAILEAICRTFPVGCLRVADRGLREGILFELMREAHLPRHDGSLPNAGREAHAE